MTRLPALLLTVALALVVSACGEPPIAFDIPARDGRQVLDDAGILDRDALEAALVEHAEAGVDIVALTYTVEGANCGEAFRAGREFVQAWEADVAIVAVAEPGDFEDADGERCVGLAPLDDFELGRGTREEISEVIWPPLIADNAWVEIFDVAADELFSALSDTTDSDDPADPADEPAGDEVEAQEDDA